MNFSLDERRSKIDRRKEVRRYIDGSVNDRRKNESESSMQYEEHVHIIIDHQRESEELQVKIINKEKVELACETIPDTLQALSQLLDRYNISMLPHRKIKR